MMRPTQRPTATGVRVRSTRDANVLFHAVTTGILPIVSRRLDAADRASLRPGCVYIWEERSPASDATGAGMERFTEGRHWYPSRVRDDFLLYVEKDWEGEVHTHSQRHRHIHPSTSTPPYPHQSIRRQPLVKQTYSAWVNIGSSLRKWHMNAYYTEDALEELRTVDDIPVLANLQVPHECYQRARSSTIGSTKSSKKPPLSSTSQNQNSGQNGNDGQNQRGCEGRKTGRSHSNTSGSSSERDDRDREIVLAPRYAPFPPTITSTSSRTPTNMSTIPHPPPPPRPLLPHPPPLFVPSQASLLAPAPSSGLLNSPGYNANRQMYPPASPSPSPSAASVASTTSMPASNPNLPSIASLVPVSSPLSASASSPISPTSSDSTSASFSAIMPSSTTVPPSTPISSTSPTFTFPGGPSHQGGNRNNDKSLLMTGTSSDRLNLVPLEQLRANRVQCGFGHGSEGVYVYGGYGYGGYGRGERRREPMDDQILRSFKPL